MGHENSTPAPIDPVRVRQAWPGLRSDGHKYDRGHCLVVSGGIESSGAARLSARAALRIGAGLVTVASPPAALLVNASALTAVMVRRCEGVDGLAGLLSDRRIKTVAIGPGLKPNEETCQLVETALGEGRNCVIDAGGLSAFAGSPSRLASAIAGGAGRAILTPHEGEFARLFADIEGDRARRARAAAILSGAVIVLKGRGTLIAAPDGRLAIDTLSPPTLATAGSGDVLTGFCAGLLSQGMPAFDAAIAAVWMHGAAALSFGPGLIAEDLEGEVPKILASQVIVNAAS